MRPGEHAPQRHQAAPPWCQTLLRALRHRGPDGSGTFVDDGVALVHTRLAMRDPEAGAQPLSTPDSRFTLVVNGELYDDDALRGRLVAAGAHFRTHSDSETLLWALALFGSDAVRAIEGEYAFCFWDSVTRTALLGRDPLGVKPLLIAEHAGAVYFASEAKALLRTVPARFPLDTDVVIESFVAPALSGGDRTPFRGMRSVPAGVTLQIDGNGMREVQRQSFSWSAGPQSVTPQALAHALRNAVRARMRADAPIGLFLSGGVDSSAIAASALDEVPSLRCYTIRFDHHRGDTAFAAPEGSIVVGDDAPFVEGLAQRWPLELRRVHAGQGALLDDLDALAASQDRMVAWEQELSQRALARASARDVKGVLVGDAADETHYGYAFALDAQVCRSPTALLSRFGFSPRRALLRREHQARADSLDAEYRALCSAAGTPYGSDLDGDRMATSQLLVARWLPRLLHNGDLHTMAFGLEARVPFADGRVLQLAAQVGVAQGFAPYAGVPEKALLRRAVSPWLPASIIGRPKSALPRDDLLGPLLRARLVERLRCPDARARLASFLDLAALDAFLLAAEPRRDETRSCLFSVLAFEGFLRHHSS